MAATNEITGDSIATKTITEAYRNNYDAIFGKKEKRVIIETELVPSLQLDGEGIQNEVPKD